MQGERPGPGPEEIRQNEPETRIKDIGQAEVMAHAENEIVDKANEYRELGLDALADAALEQRGSEAEKVGNEYARDKRDAMERDKKIEQLQPLLTEKLQEIAAFDMDSEARALEVIVFEGGSITAGDRNTYNMFLPLLKKEIGAPQKAHYSTDGSKLGDRENKAASAITQVGGLDLDLVRKGMNGFMGNDVRRDRLKIESFSTQLPKIRLTVLTLLQDSEEVRKGGGTIHAYERQRAYLVKT